MVTDAFMGALLSFLTWVASGLPTWTPPAWIAEMSGHVATLASYVVSVSAWLPFDLLDTALQAVGACLVAALGIKLARIVASFLTLGGGSAA